MFRCKVCGWLHAGDVPPDVCPSCGSPADRFRPVATGLGIPGVAQGLTPGARIRLLALVPATIDSPFARHDGPRLDVVTGDSAWFEDNIPCMRACPVNTDVATYIGHVAGGAFGLAAQINREQNIFAGTLGRTCSRPCEDACRRTVIDNPIQIRALKRVATDHAIEGTTVVTSPLPESTGRHIAIVGAGIAGLTVARQLRLSGHAVTIFERDATLGGLMVSGVPAWRLPRDVAETDINSVTALGVAVRTGRALGRDLSVTKLSAEFDAVVIATGAQSVVRLPGTAADGTSPSGSLPGVIDGLSFLRDIARGGTRAEGPVVVIGGGYTAFDCARTARRLASGPVTMVMRQDPELSIAADELTEAVAEGIEILATTAFVRFVTTEGTSTGVVVRDGIGAERTLPCTLLIAAIGQEPDKSVIDLPSGEVRTLADPVVVDADGRLGGWPNVWLAGDVMDGSTSFIEAIASGKRAANAIERSLSRAGIALDPSSQTITIPVELDLEARVDIAGAEGDHTVPAWTRDLLHRRIIEHEPYRERAQQTTSVLALTDRGLASGNPVTEVDLGMTGGIGEIEASRCLQCQANIAIDGDRCILCNGCVDVCPYGCIEMLGLDRLESIDGEPIDRLDGLNSLTVAMLINEDSCIRCGKCVDWCPTSCLTMSAHAPIMGGSPNAFDIRSLLA